MLEKVQGAIFDADGTLLDSMPLWQEIGERYLKTVGRTAKPGLAQELAAHTFNEGVQYVIDEYQLTQSPEEVSRDIFDIAQAFYKDEVQFKPGVRDVLAYLAERDVPMVIATSSRRKGVEQALDRLQARHYFKEIFTSDEVGAGKQNPKIFLTALEALDTPKEATYVFEDAFFAIKTANQIGLVTVGIYDLYSESDEKEVEKAADYYFQDFNALLANEGNDQ